MRKPPADKPAQPPVPKPEGPWATDMLTDTEIEALRCDAREAAAIAAKAFAHLRPKGKG